MINRFQAACTWAVCSALTACAVDAAAQRATIGTPRVTAVYVSAVERNGVPVTGLTARDFVLKEGGEVREIVRVEPATAPIHVAMIVDDSGTGIFRSSVADFVDRLLGRAQFSIKRVVAQVQTLVDYTTDIDQLRKAVLSLKAMSETPDGGQVVEGIFEASKELQARDAARPVIVVLTDTDAEYSSLPAKLVLEQLRRSGTLLYVVGVVRLPVLRTSPNSTANAGPALPGAQSAVERPSDLIDRQIDINQVLGDGPKQTGGRRVEITGGAGPPPVLQAIAEELNHQYLITYIVPAGEKPSQKLSVSSQRRGVSVRAPQQTGSAGN